MVRQADGEMNVAWKDGHHRLAAHSLRHAVDVPFETDAGGTASKQP